MRRSVPLAMLISVVVLALVVLALVQPAQGRHYQRFMATEDEKVIASFGADEKSLVAIRTEQSLVDSGSDRGRGAIRLETRSISGWLRSVSTLTAWVCSPLR